MARERRFQNIRVSKQVYVNSMTQYSTHVYFTEAGKRKHYLWGIRDSCLTTANGRLDHRRVPKYVMDAIMREMLRLTTDEQLTFYEYDRDGEKRYDGLRYHEPEYFAAIVKAV